MKSFVSCAVNFSAVLAIVLWFAGGEAAAQGAVGSGPLTSSLAQSAPESGVIRLGVVSLAPGLTIREIGHDDNVYDVNDNPTEDWVVAATPDVSAFARTRFAQLSAYAGSDMQWYKDEESERAIGHMFRGRVDFLLSRFSPFIGAGRTRTRTRPNGEIDVRADLQNDEVSGGIAYVLSGHAQLFGSAIRTETDYRDAFQSGISLEQSLSRRSTEYQGGLKTDLTPLLSMQVRGGFRKDEFVRDPLRNGESRNAMTVFTFDPAAIIGGIATFGYQDYRPDDPLVSAYRGMVGSGLLTYRLLEIARINLGYTRGIEYSFDTAEAYYLENTFRAIYTQRLFGEVDMQGQASHSAFNYGQRAGAVDRSDTLEAYNGNLGYNLRNRTRVALNYEYARRRSPEIAERNYVRRRVFLSWMVAF